MSNLVFRSIKVNGRPAMVGNRALGVFRLAPYTLRLRYTDGVTPTFSTGAAVQMSTSPNIWDLTNDSNSWYGVLQGHTGLLEVVDSGDMSGVRYMSSAFSGCTSLVSICPMNVRLNKVRNMFKNCSSLVSVPLITINLSSGESFDYMFDGCTSLTSVPLLNTYSSNTTTTNYMFRNCSSLTTIPAFNLTRVTSAGSMFEGCSSLTTVPALNLSQASNGLGGMFKGCSSLTTMPSITIPYSLRSCSSMFEECINIESGILDMYNTLYTALYNARSTYYSSCFKNCGSNTTAGAAELAQVPSTWK